MLFNFLYMAVSRRISIFAKMEVKYGDSFARFLFEHT